MANRKDTKCFVCGKTFGSSNRAKTCSYKCRDVLRKKNRIKKANKAECFVCKEIKPLIYNFRKYKLCSKRCCQVLSSRIYRISNPEKIKEFQGLYKLGEQRICGQCGKTFTNTNWKQRFCSMNCSDKWNYKFGKKGTTAKLRNLQKRTELDNRIGFCVLCKTPIDKIKSKTELGMHKNHFGKFEKDHIQPYSKGGKDNKDNIRYVCWFCNRTRLNLDIKYDAIIGKIGELFWKEINKEIR